MVIDPQLAQTRNHITDCRPSVRTSTRRAAKVLVVEDHEDTRLLYRYVLESRGCQVIEAQDGEEAISKAESIQPDIILMDTSLPGVDGLTAMLRIRTLETMRSVPIIFLSGHAQQKAREVAIATGATEYLIKPVLLDELESAVRTHLKRDLQWKKDAESSEETV